LTQVRRRGGVEVAQAEGDAMKELIELIVKALVDYPEQVSVSVIEGSRTRVLELRVAKEDLGKVIGKQGRNARAIRTILGAASAKLDQRFVLEILE
jgi:predicted RNA-binding protein YlqC (UPF0109 family)